MNSKQSFEYVRDVVKRPYAKGEKSISRSAKYSYLYAFFILGRRFELGEKAIARSTEYSWRYAVDILRGKLPEELHNRMLAKATFGQSDKYTDLYFKHLANLDRFSILSSQLI